MCGGVVGKEGIDYYRLRMNQFDGSEVDGAGELIDHVDAGSFRFGNRGHYIADGIAHDMNRSVYHDIWDLEGVVAKDEQVDDAASGFQEDKVSGAGLCVQDHISCKVL